MNTLSNYSPCYVLESTDSGLTTLDLESRLMMSRILFLTKEVGQASVNKLISQFLYLDSMSNDPIKLLIDSPGGSVIHGLCLIDLFDNLKSPVHTTVIGTAYSMAAVILSAGAKGERAAYKNAEIMFHDMSGAVGHSNFEKEFKPLYKSYVEVHESLYKKMAETTGKPAKTIKKDLFKKDIYFNPNAAIEYGIIDKIFTRK